MLQYVFGRVLRMVPVIAILSIFVFSLMQMLPGDPVSQMLSESQAMSAKAVEAMREHLGLNDPIYVQYGRYISRALRGDLGRSIQTNRPVLKSITELFPNTLELAGSATAVAALLGIVLGTIAAVRKHSLLDSGSMVLALMGVSMPIFLIGILLMLLFSVKLHLIPIFSRGGFVGLILPAISLGWGSAGIIARLVRTSLLEVLGLDFVQTARAKGLKESVVIVRHALRNALGTVVTLLGLQFGSLLGGAIITESVFARQGIGRLAVNAVLKKDFPTVQGTILVIALAYMIVNLFVDILCAYLDPRIRYH